MKTFADRAYYNGNVYTVDSTFSKASAFCIKDGRFLAVGEKADIEPLCGPETTYFDLRGRTVLPGLIDAHLHVTYTGDRLLKLDLYEKSKEEILSMVAREVERTPPSRWIQGMGWDQNKWEDKSFPTKEDLDAVAKDVPVCLKRACGHCTWANGKAMELAGMTADLPDPKGGEFMRAASGELTGIVIDQAQEAFYKVIPPEEPRDILRNTLVAQEAFFKNGLTGVHDMGSPPETVDLWKRAYEDGNLKVRIYAALKVPGRPREEELITRAKEYMAGGPEIGLYGRRLTVRCYKLMADGSLGARSAWMLEDYADRPGHRSSPRMTDYCFAAVAGEAIAKGFQLATHAIGDAAVRRCLDVYESALRVAPAADRRWRIEHAQVIAPEDVSRFAELKIVPTCQTAFLGTDKLMAEDRLGRERVKTAYVWRTLIDEGNPVPNGTDSPVEGLNPFRSMYCAVARRAVEEGSDAASWYPEQGLDRREALLSYTLWAAYAAFEEDIKGSIEVGKLADFVVIDRDMMTCSLWDMAHTKVLTTVVGGETVYDSSR